MNASITARDLTTLRAQLPAKLARHPAFSERDRNPAAVYLASLGKGSRRAMLQALRKVAELLTGKETHPVALPWWELEYQHTQALRSQLAERYAPAAANKILAALRGVLREAWRLGHMGAEAYHRAADVKVVKGQPVPKGRAITTGEIVALVNVCADDPSPIGVRDTAMLAVLWSGGLRRAEVVSLDLADYEPESGALTVRQAKGGKGRIVYLKNGASEAVDAWLEERGQEGGPLFYRFRKGGAMLPERITDQTVMATVLKRAKQANIRPFSPHDLRRTYAGELLDAGADLITVQNLMGHASPNTTARYDRRGERAKQAASARIAFPYTRERA